MDYEELESKCQWLQAQNAALLKLLGESKTCLSSLTGYLENDLSEHIAQESVVDSREIKRLQQELERAEQLRTAIEKQLAELPKGYQPKAKK